MFLATLIPHALTTMLMLVVLVAFLLSASLAIKYKILPFGMAVMDTITGFVTAPGNPPGNFTAVTLAAGDTLQIRNFNPPSRAFAISLWGKHQVAGNIRYRSPKFHDNVQAIRAFDVINSPNPLLGLGQYQELSAQDTTILEVNGSAVAGDIETASVLVWYEDIPGLAGRFASEEDCKARGRNLLMIEQAIVTGVVGGYSGQQAINAAASGDLMKANTDYAVLGYTVSANVATVSIRGVDTGNLRCSGPGNSLEQDLTAQWFLYLSRTFKTAMIPVINSANKGGTFADCAKDENALTFNLIWNLLELA